MDTQEDILPSRDVALELLKELKVPFPVRRHSIKVAELAIRIAKKIKKSNLNIKLVEIGALLHDIGRSETHGFNHALIGGKIIRDLGYSEKLARICETHILGGVDKGDARMVGLPEKDYLPESLEEKIVCLADKLTTGRKTVSVKERFERWFQKYGKTKLLVKSKKRILQFQKEIKDLM